MFKSLQVSNFRSLRDVKLQKLKRLNLVTGSNGGGKTSLLEAVFLNAGAANPHLALSINSFRGDNIITPSSDHTFRSWFWESDEGIESDRRRWSCAGANEEQDSL